ncbi:hypothetical protein G7Y89_g13242 [Cudoniella acicularis]|uniref:Uncharacterized protein n=1 Tax=Cudoniella acicularis TaxID=354080 RepID=A0A8H4VWL8_9HELO|nr:hypothetical protein G7Y89_g13242 [Cudoniella acicularis]
MGELREERPKKPTVTDVIPLDLSESVGVGRGAHPTVSVLEPVMCIERTETDFRIVARFKLQVKIHAFEKGYKKRLEKFFDFVSVRYLYHDKEKHEVKPNGDKFPQIHAKDKMKKSWFEASISAIAIRKAREEEKDFVLGKGNADPMYMKCHCAIKHLNTTTEREIDPGDEVMISKSFTGPLALIIVDVHDLNRGDPSLPMRNLSYDRENQRQRLEKLIQEEKLAKLKKLKEEAKKRQKERDEWQRRARGSSQRARNTSESDSSPHYSPARCRTVFTEEGFVSVDRLEDGNFVDSAKE